jgi:ATP-dependent Clp protease ATP-binding subunit ClpC
VDQKISISMKKKTREYLINKGFDEKFGARPLRRLLQKELEDPLSMEILKGRFAAGDVIDVDFRGEKIVFRKQESRKALKAPAQPAGLLTGEKEVEKVPT